MSDTKSMQEDSPLTNHDRGEVTRSNRERVRSVEERRSSLHSGSRQERPPSHSTLSGSQHNARMSESSEEDGSDRSTGGDPSCKGI